MKIINKVPLRQRWGMYKSDPWSLVLFLMVCLAAVITMGALLFVIAYILVKGIPHLSPGLFAWEYNSENVSLMPALINTIFMTVLALLMAVPAGIGAAVYLTEYAKYPLKNIIAGKIKPM